MAKLLTLLVVIAVGLSIIGTAIGMKRDTGLELPSLTSAVESARDFIGQSAGGLNCYNVTYANGTVNTVCE